MKLSDQDADKLSHALCMGIRKGLFGANAEDFINLWDCIPNNYSEEIASGLESIADAINKLADVLSEQRRVS